MLHRCAQQIVEQHGGRFRENAEALLALPGIGRYTAAAIASIAFAEPVAVVDGNVERVLQRLTGINLDCAANLATCAGASRELAARGFQSGHDGTRRHRVRAARAPVRWCARCGNGVCTQGEVSAQPGRRPARIKKEIWCVLEWRDGEATAAEVVKSGWCNARKMPRSCPACGNCRNRPSLRAHCRRQRTGARFAIRLPLPTTLFTCCGMRAPLQVRSPAAKGKWIAIDRIPQIPSPG